MLVNDSMEFQLSFTGNCKNDSVLFMAKGKDQAGEKGGSWVFRDIPRPIMQRMKVAAAIEGKSLKQLLLDLSEAHLKDLEKKGMIPKGKYDQTNLLK